MQHNFLYSLVIGKCVIVQWELNQLPFQEITSNSKFHLQIFGKLARLFRRLTSL